MNLSDIADQYADRFLIKYSPRLLPGQIKALKAIPTAVEHRPPV